jgi:hypothetical protein
MRDYRAFVFGRNGRVVDRHEFWCANDEEAKERARQYVDGHDIELWHQGQKIAEFKGGPTRD